MRDNLKFLEELQGDLARKRAPQGPPAPPAAQPMTQAGLAQAFQAATAQASRQRPRKLSPEEELVALQRKWHLVQPFPDGKGQPGDGLPGDLATLRQVIPSGLRPMEVRAFLYGSLEEAKHIFLRVFNTSWSKRDLGRRLLEAGVPNGLQGFDKGTRKELEGAIRLLSD